MEEGNSKQNVSARRPANRKRAERIRMRASGFKLVQCWVHEDDAGRVKRYVGKLRAARGESEEG